MKSFLRSLLQALGLYETAGVWVARFKGLSRGIRISQTPESNYRVANRVGQAIIINKRHAIYLSDMVVFFSFFFDGVVPDANNEVHYENPGWHTPRGWDRPVYFTSYAESNETLDLYSKLAAIQPGDVVLDIGAYCGLTSLEFAEKVTATGHVYAFEADPENFAAFQKNLENSGLKNLTAEHLAVWKESGTLEFQADGTAGSRVLSVSGRSNSTVRVKSTTLTDYIAAQKINRIDLLKIDVEGAEAEILAASRNVLREFKPALIVELHPVHDVWTTCACESILREEGYETSITPQPGTDCPLLVATLRKG